LVCADAEMAVSHKAVVRGAQLEPVFRFVEHDEIVPRTLHFGKTDLHERNYHWRSGVFDGVKDIDAV
jgi:hypothetical protein